MHGTQGIQKLLGILLRFCSCPYVFTWSILDLAKATQFLAFAFRAAPEFPRFLLYSIPSEEMLLF